MMPVIRRLRSTLVLLAILVYSVGSSADAFGGLIVHIEDVSFVPGQVGVVSVWVSSTDADSFSIFNYEFLITGSLGNVSTLRFTQSQSDNEINDDNYVFNVTAGGSGGFTSIADNPPFFDTLQGGDGLATGGDISVDSDKKLLVQLDVEHVLPMGVSPETSVGDSFQISLIESANTFFVDSSSEYQEISPISYSSYGNLSITATPEPSATLLAVFSCLGAYLFKRKGATAKGSYGGVM